MARAPNAASSFGPCAGSRVAASTCIPVATSAAAPEHGSPGASATALRPLRRVRRSLLCSPPSPFRAPRLLCSSSAAASRLARRSRSRAPPPPSPRRSSLRRDARSFLRGFLAYEVGRRRDPRSASLLRDLRHPRVRRRAVRAASSDPRAAPPSPPRSDSPPSSSPPTRPALSISGSAQRPGGREQFSFLFTALRLALARGRARRVSAPEARYSASPPPSRRAVLALKISLLAAAALLGLLFIVGLFVASAPGAGGGGQACALQGDPRRSPPTTSPG